MEVELYHLSIHKMIIQYFLQEIIILNLYQMVHQLKFSLIMKNLIRMDIMIIQLIIDLLLK